LKAYTGFVYTPEGGTKNIISGNWGCGCFNGDLQLKLLIQWIAASLAGKKLVHCPFGKNL
jgi:poly(ADP-ribose) glycohydrolase